MHFSIHVPEGLNAEEILAIVKGLNIDNRKHGIVVKHKPINAISVLISMCDFDPYKEMPRIVCHVAEAIQRALDWVYEVVCDVPEVAGAYCLRPAYAIG